MARIGIVGDGPGGLSAALFLAKADHEVVVYGTDGTAMNHAYLYNYLGIPEIAGAEFQSIARAQVAGFGGHLVDIEVDAVGGSKGAFTITTADGEAAFEYLVLTEGKNASLAESLGLQSGDDGGVVVNRHGRSSVDGIYVVGRSVRPTRSQAIISAGDGAAAALDILAREAGKDIQDWDTPPKGD